MTTTTKTHDSELSGVLYLALELGDRSWKLAFTVGLGQRPRLRNVASGSVSQVQEEIVRAKERFGLPSEAAVRSCYEAGRDGFWLHRQLLSVGIENLVVDSSSIEVNRRKRRAKSDALDATKLVAMLVRFHLGEERIWGVVQPPSPEQEDERQLHRAIESMQQERRQLANRMSGLLVTVGIRLRVNRHFGRRLAELRQPDGEPLLPGLLARLQWEFERWQLVHRQLVAAERELKQRVAQEAAGSRAVQHLLSLRGIGAKGAWLLLREGLVWRAFLNRRQVGAWVGLTPTPYDSGTSQREQGISKAGNARLRTLLVELAWGWLGYQPQSGLSAWYYRRFGAAGGRSRKVGIVALARKLLIALWRCARDGELPVGAVTVDWRSKLPATVVRDAAA